MHNPPDPIRRELVTWEEVDKLIDILVPQIKSVSSFDGMVIITRGGIIPGGLLAEALDITHVLTAAVRFRDPLFEKISTQEMSLMGLPSFLQFPEDRLLRGRKILVVDDVWGSGRTSTAVKNKVSAAGGIPFTSVLHFNPHRNRFGATRPDYFAASTDAHIVYPWEGEPTAGWAKRDY